MTKSVTSITSKRKKWGGYDISCVILNNFTGVLTFSNCHWWRNSSWLRIVLIENEIHWRFIENQHVNKLATPIKQSIIVSIALVQGMIAFTFLHRFFCMMVIVFEEHEAFKIGTWQCKSLCSQNFFANREEPFRTWWYNWIEVYEQLAKACKFTHKDSFILCIWGGFQTGIHWIMRHNEVWSSWVSKHGVCPSQQVFISET